MSKNEFLETMRLSLEGRVPADYQAYLLEKYEAYFRAAGKDGKSEEETAAALGNPAGICRGILGSASAEAAGPELASLNRRLAACLIDGAVNVLFMLALLFPVGLLMYGDGSFWVARFLPLLLINSCTGGGLLTVLVLWLTHGLTLGKRLLGMRVIRADGSRLGFGTALFREFFLKGIFGFIGTWLFALISLAWAMAKGPDCTIQDKLAGTLVIRTNKQS